VCGVCVPRALRAIVPQTYPNMLSTSENPTFSDVCGGGVMVCWVHAISGYAPVTQRTRVRRFERRAPAVHTIRSVTCTKCGSDKEEAEFNWRSRPLNIRQRQCRTCTREMLHKHYERNKPYYKEKAHRQRTNPGKLRVKCFVYKYLLSHPCVDCGELDPVVLEFDHRDPSLKVVEISNMMRVRDELQVMTEIAKCDVRCANCHRRRTAKQNHWYANLAPVLALASNQ
jgi:hypothetical protein